MILLHGTTRARAEQIMQKDRIRDSRNRPGEQRLELRPEANTAEGAKDENSSQKFEPRSHKDLPVV
jgi:hypothetical protein